MTNIFLKMAQVSIHACWLVLAVVVLRLILKGAPKWIRTLLWAVVGIRLALPFSIKSIFSLVPPAGTGISRITALPVTPAGDAAPMITGTVNTITGQPAATPPADPMQTLLPILSYIWIAGMVLLLAYTAFTYIRLRRAVREAVLYRDNVYLAGNIPTPFVLGLTKPKIYLPSHMGPRDIPHVLAHENAHIRRKDHWWKPVGFLLLSLHWYNPFIWLAYLLLCRDIELACDEKVVKELDHKQRADYSQTLLHCSIHQKTIAACPLAFGEGNVKKRIKTVLNYKKPGFWILATALVACIVVGVCFLTDPAERGVRSISASENGDGFTVNIDYWGLKGFYAEMLQPNEGEYNGDTIVSYDGALGPYRAMITFFDADPSPSFARQYPAGTVCPMEDVPPSLEGKLKVKRVQTSDHSFILYVGCEIPFAVEAQSDTQLSPLPGNIRLNCRPAPPSEPVTPGVRLSVGMPALSSIDTTAAVQALPISACDFTYFSGDTGDIVSQIHTVVRMSAASPDLFVDTPLSLQQCQSLAAEGLILDLTPYLEDRNGPVKLMWDALPANAQPGILDSLGDPTTGKIFVIPLCTQDNTKTAVTTTGAFITSACTDPDLAFALLMQIYYGR